MSLRDVVSASQDDLHVARAQYLNGLVDYLTVVDAERTLLGNQLLLAHTVNLEVGAASISSKLWGGGWESPP